MSLLDFFEESERGKNSVHIYVTDSARKVASFDTDDLKVKSVPTLAHIKSKKNEDTAVIISQEESKLINEESSQFIICLLDSEQPHSIAVLNTKNELGAVKQAIDAFYELSSKRMILSKVDEMRSNSKELYKRINSIVLENISIENKEIIYEAFWKGREVQREKKEFSSFQAEICSIFSATGFVHDPQLVNLDDLKFSERDAFSLEWICENLFIQLDKKVESSPEFDLVVFFMIEVIDRYFMTANLEKSSSSKTTIWEESFHQLTFPMAIIADHGDLVLYNSAFTHLEILPSNCLKLKNGDVFNLEDVYYDVFIKELEGRSSEKLFFFKKVNSNKDQLHREGNDLSAISSTELGIISSSIAHELNNPLAGILAAISLLELEEWDHEAASSIADMKSSAKRCKDLVDIFLSFSNSRDLEKKAEDPRSALTQAMDLLRFRMIESGVRIKVNINNSDEPFGKEINLSLSTMIFYMLLGEIITSFNRNQMVTGKKEELIEINYREKRDDIILTINSSLSQIKNIIDSKLMSYLLGVLGLEMTMEDKKIQLTARTMI